MAEALAIWEHVFGKITNLNPLWYVFSIKKAVLETQQDDAALKEKGIKALEALAHDVDNIFRDEALYFLGFFDRRAWRALDAEFGATDFTSG